MNTIFYESKHGMGADYFTLEQNHDFSFPLHIHRCYEIILLLEGSMRVQIEKEKYEIFAGDMILIKPNSVHSLETLETSKHILCIFAPELIAAVSGQIIKYPFTSPVLRNVGASYRELFTGMEEGANIAKIKGFLYCISGLFYEQLDFSKKDTSSNDTYLLRDIFLYVENNINTPCSLVNLADALDYSASYLSRFFDKNVGISYSAYVRNIKIGHACYLLRNTDDSIMNIAHKCGYPSIVTFNHNFKQLTGSNPTEYRKRMEWTPEKSVKEFWRDPD